MQLFEYDRMDVAYSSLCKVTLTLAVLHGFVCISLCFCEFLCQYPAQLTDRKKLFNEP